MVFWGFVFGKLKPLFGCFLCKFFVFFFLFFFGGGGDTDGAYKNVTDFGVN